jgi:hypothetical protein
VNLRQTYLDAAEYVRVHGFSPGYGYSDGGPRCFLGALDSTTDHVTADNAGMRGPLREVVPNYSWSTLNREGWTTNDAIAAFEIAADLATP